MNVVGLCGVAGSGKDTVADFLVKNHGFVKVAFADPLKRICKEVFQFTDEQLWGPSEKRNEADRRYLVSEGYAKAVRTEEEAAIVARQHDDIPAAEEHERMARSYATQAYLTPRYALQQLGSEWGRRCYQNVWVDYALRTAKEVLEEGVEYWPTRGTTVERADERADGVVISDVRFRNEVLAIQAAGGKVVRIVRKDAGLKGAASQHASETEQLTIPVELFDANLINGGMGLELLEVAVGGLVETLRLV